jgi:putative hemolysin
MVPRVKIKALSSKTTVEEAIEYYLSHTYSRIPVYKKTIDNIENYLTIRDIIKEDKKKKLSELNLPEVLKAPLNKPISKLLNTFQKSNKHIAILIDEYG